MVFSPIGSQREDVKAGPAKTGKEYLIPTCTNLETIFKFFVVVGRNYLVRVNVRVILDMEELLFFLFGISIRCWGSWEISPQ